jgi:hypothetical protein
MAEAVYVLCALTSAACAAMLLRGYLRSRARFLLWSSLCFIALTLNNLLLVIDKVVFPERVIAVAEWRSAIALVGMAVLMYGLVWEAE